MGAARKNIIFKEVFMKRKLWNESK